MLRMFGLGAPAEVTVLVEADSQRVLDIIELAVGDAAIAEMRLRAALKSLFADHVPDEIPLALQSRFLQALVHVAAWPGLQSESMQYKDLNQTKDQLVELIFRQKDQNDSLNAALQALCKRTFLGAIFHETRHHYCGWTPSICTGRLQALAVRITKLITEMGTAAINLSPDTRVALREESVNNPKFETYLDRYPLLGMVLRPYLISAKCEADSRLVF